MRLLLDEVEGEARPLAAGRLVERDGEGEVGGAEADADHVEGPVMHGHGDHLPLVV